ncbi:MAG: hypothetical protein QM730_04435 [Anaerolineales bacterium]
MDPVKILKRSWTILWSYRALWAFGLIIALAAGGAGSHGSNNSRYEQRQGQNQQLTPHDMQLGWQEFKQEISKAFEQGFPKFNITGESVRAFVWLFVAFIVVMMLVGIVMAIARYVSETAVIKMVDDYESTGNQMTVRQGFRLGWSKKAWRLFLINLIVNLPAIALMLVLLIAGIGVYLAWVNGTANFATFSTIATVVLVFITIFVVVILSIVLNLLRNFFWRVSVLEDLGVRESLKRGWTFVLENWKNVGLMWLVMIGLGIVWAFVSIILIIVSIPIVIVTAVIAALVSALPYLLFAGIFSTFLTGWLPWVAGAIFIAPLFFTIAFSPWVLIGSWQAVYTSTVWTLTYREIKALPVAAAAAPKIEPPVDVPPAS